MIPLLVYSTRKKLRKSFSTTNLTESGSEDGSDDSGRVNKGRALPRSLSQDKAGESLHRRVLLQNYRKALSVGREVMLGSTPDLSVSAIEEE